MIDLLRKMMDLTLGIAAVTKDKASAVVDELVKRGELTREAGDKVIDELVQKGQAARSELSATIEAQVTKLLERMRVATQKDIADLKARMDRMERGTQGD